VIRPMVPAVALCLVTYSATGQQNVDAVHAPLLADIRTAASQKLRFPASAQFERMKQTVAELRGEPTTVVCGYVKARNRFGAYEGAMPFAYVVKTKDFVIERPGLPDRRTIRAALKRLCDGLS
jgi:hypothetical protein